MTVFRSMVIVLMLGVMGSIVVFMRAETLRLAAESQRLDQDCVRLRREAWDLQMAIARLRNPQEIENRVRIWDLDMLVAPDGDRPADGWVLADAR